VCLILAFAILRDILRERGESIGPILTLSYKNHALDEFVVDLLRQKPSLSHGQALIRLGKPDNIELDNFTERNSVAESRANKELEIHLGIMNYAKTKYHQWLGFSSAGNVLNASQLIECAIFVALCSIKFNKGQQELQKIINDAILLVDGIHWINSFTQALEYWLQGETPPPRCEFVNERSPNRCMKIACAGKSFCIEFHCCNIENCKNQRVNIEGVNFCEKHRCKAAHLESPFPFCLESRMNNNVVFCANHICILCGENERIHGTPVCGSNTCRCNTSGCLRPRMIPFLFCTEHCCHSCQRLGTFNALSCTVFGSNLCSEHKCIQPGCMSAKDDFRSHYCELHRCALYWDANTRGSTMCDQHRCCFKDDDYHCVNSRCIIKNIGTSNFCDEHTCIMCIQEKGPLNMPVDNFLFGKWCGLGISCRSKDTKSVP
jgi:hypothetical protein